MSKEKEHPLAISYTSPFVQYNPDKSEAAVYKDVLSQITHRIHFANVFNGWWTTKSFYDTNIIDLKHPSILKFTIPTKLALAHSELSEALEGFRKGLKDDHLPARPMIEVELADAIIRILDIAGALNLDIGGALVEKFNYNQTRADHKPEARNAEGGKSI